jgi:hypothetical protein
MVTSSSAIYTINKGRVSLLINIHDQYMKREKERKMYPLYECITYTLCAHGDRYPCAVVI